MHVYGMPDLIAKARPGAPPKTNSPPQLNNAGWTPLQDDFRQKAQAANRMSDWSGLPENAKKLASQNPWILHARDIQVPPPDGWRSFVFMGGRGAGKTRAGAEWLRWSMIHGRCRRAALVGPALHDVREVMIDGPSGLKWIEPLRCRRPHYSPSRRILSFDNGAEAHVFSAEDPDSLRGPQFDVAWCDEIAAWLRGKAVWDTLQMGLRLGADPRVMATTTPRPTDFFKGLLAAPGTLVRRASMSDNAENLSDGFVAAMEAAYGNSALARQEIHGELLEDAEGALFRRQMIDAARVSEPPMLEDVIVAVDPPATSGAAADACGIIAAGVREGVAYVLADASAPGLKPLDWARRAVAVCREVGAREIIAESNQGGEMVRQVLESAGADVPVRLVHARLGKRARAAPVATLYEQRRVAHVGLLPTLEDQMCQFGAEGIRGSPDRVDALVWAIWALLQQGGGPWVRVL
jgi:phage terminase large subunit-like protein